MHAKQLLLLAAAAALYAGCAADQAPNYNLSRTSGNSGKMTRGSDVAYRAICTNIVAGSHAGVSANDWTFASKPGCVLKFKEYSPNLRFFTRYFPYAKLPTRPGFD